MRDGIVSVIGLRAAAAAATAAATTAAAAAAKGVGRGGVRQQYRREAVDEQHRRDEPRKPRLHCAVVACMQPEVEGVLMCVYDRPE